MPIRITGMYSGLDTEAIIAELASAQSMKKNSLVKKQISLSWKMDAWKALNTKIYSFYSKTLDNMRFQGSYSLKTTKVSSSSVSVITKNNAVNGVQNLKIEQMAKEGYLTGADLSETYGGKLSSSSTLGDLGIEDGSFSVEIGGKPVQINVTGNMKISDLVSKLQSAGVNASFDEKNQRFFISSQKSGEKYNFHLIGDNENGMDALSKLGLLTQADLESDEYKKWKAYGEDNGKYQDALQKEIDKRAASYKAANDSLQKTLDKLGEEPGASEYLNKDLEELRKMLQGDGDENPGSLQAALDERTKALEEAQKALEKAQADLKAAQEEDPADSDKIKDLQDKVNVASSALTERTSELNSAKGEYSMAEAVYNTRAAMKDNQKYYEVDPETGEVSADSEGNLRRAVEKDFDAKIGVANNLNKWTPSEGATKIEGQDAEIYLNGAKFKSESNTFDINGLEITVLEENKGETITLSTGEDIDGLYNMIKNFITEYNKLINEMDALYNADSAKGYDPLLTEEKDGLSDSEIEEWEKKIKDAILRRDSTLGSVSGALSNVMLAGANVDGVQMFLSQFGINTLGYLNAADNEKHAYHIDGDPDDANTMTNEDVLRSMIASDPDTVMKFFSQLSKNVYDELGRQMAGTTASSAFTVYNDKTMKEEYEAYTEKITKQETKLNNLMDKWYKKFSSMETAMAKLQSKNNAISSMLGG